MWTFFPILAAVFGRRRRDEAQRIGLSSRDKWQAVLAGAVLFVILVAAFYLAARLVLA